MGGFGRRRQSQQHKTSDLSGYNLKHVKAVEHKHVHFTWSIYNIKEKDLIQFKPIFPHVWLIQVMAYVNLQVQCKCNRIQRLCISLAYQCGSQGIAVVYKCNNLLYQNSCHILVIIQKKLN